MILLIGQVLHTVMELVDLKNFLAMKNLTLSNRLHEAQYNSKEGFKKVVWFIVWLAYHRRSYGGGHQSVHYLYGFMIDRT